MHKYQVWFGMWTMCISILCGCVQRYVHIEFIVLFSVRSATHLELEHNKRREKEKVI